MNKIINLLFKIFPILIIAYGAYSSYETWLEHEAILQNLENERVMTEQRIEEMRKKNKEIEEFKKNLEISRARIQEVNRQMETLKKQLPNTISDTDVLDLLSNEATSMNLKKLILEPLKETQEDFYYAKQYHLKGDGTFIQFLIFLERMGAQERIYNVKTMEMLRENDQRGRFQILNTDIVLEAYRYNPEKDEAMLKEMNEKKESESAPKSAPVRSSGGGDDA